MNWNWSRLLNEAHELKRQKKAGIKHLLLAGQMLAMIFEKSSTRTHISFEVGMNQLGGHALFLNAGDMQIRRGEEIQGYGPGRVALRLRDDDPRLQAQHHRGVRKICHDPGHQRPLGSRTPLPAPCRHYDHPGAFRVHKGHPGRLGRRRE